MGPDKNRQPLSDTATDWDEWMERHGERPRPLPGVADAEGRFTLDTTEPLPVQGGDTATEKQKTAARKNVRKAAQAAKRQRTIAHLPKRTRTALSRQASKVAKASRARRRSRQL